MPERKCFFFYYQELTLKCTLAILVICSRNISWFDINYNIKIEIIGIKIQMTVILQLRWHWSPAGGSEDKFSAPCCMSQAPKVLMHAKLLKLKCWFEIHGVEEGSVTPVTALGPLGRSHPLNRRAKLREAIPREKCSFSEHCSNGGGVIPMFKNYVVNFV